MTSRPAPQSYLNYRGDVRNGLAIGHRGGPTTYGAWMYVVSIDYDEDADRTRVGMSAVNPISEPVDLLLAAEPSGIT